MISVKDITKLASKYAKVTPEEYTNTIRNFTERTRLLDNTLNSDISKVIEGWVPPTDYSNMRATIEEMKESPISCYVYNVQTLTGFIKHTTVDNTELLACLLVAIMEGDLRVEGKMDYFNV